MSETLEEMLRSLKSPGLIYESVINNAIIQMLTTSNDLYPKWSKTKKLQDIALKKSKGLLNSAVLQGNTNLVQMLIQHKADVNEKRYGIGPLFSASLKGNVDLVQILLENKADIDADFNRGTALEKAITEGHTDVVKILIDNNANWVYDYDFLYEPDPRDEYIPFPMVVGAMNNAIHCGKKDIVQLLIENKANVADDNNQTIAEACSVASTDIVELLLKHKASVNHEMFPPLFHACFHTEINMVQFLLQKKANLNQTICVDVNAENIFAGDVISPLHIASAFLNRGMVELLIRQKANVNYETPKKGLTALNISCSVPPVTPNDECWFNKKQHKAVVEILLQNKANVNHPDINKSPLYVSSRWGYAYVVDMLLQHKANVNQKTNEESILHISSKYGNAEVINVLLRHKANVNQTITYDGLSPLHLATDHAAIEYVYDGWSRFSFSDATETIKLLLGAGADHNMKNQEGVSVCNEVGKAIKTNHAFLKDVWNLCVRKYARTKKQWNPAEFEVDLNKAMNIACEHELFSRNALKKLRSYFKYSLRVKQMMFAAGCHHHRRRQFEANFCLRSWARVLHQPSRATKRLPQDNEKTLPNHRQLQNFFLRYPGLVRSIGPLIIKFTRAE